jgi:GTPase SAR1 family protein
MEQNEGIDVADGEIGVEQEEPADVETVAQADEVAEMRKPNPMRTVLHQFAESFTAGVEPMMDPLARVQCVIEQSVEGDPVRATLPGLRDVTHHLGALLQKVQEQHAYVLIFGPLKSGKSTLMNSICSSYVSEVTALPAYPCLVHMSHGDEARFKVTRYDGSEEVFADQKALYAVVERGHSELTKRLREVEESGESFEPATHMPSALRVIDVILPSHELAASGAVLVDTPGLYSRMKFGYDRMTRDFRDAAACAIFVVKSDNLFLEQVFDEFTDLLDLFSRIFLIVNLDSRKCDLTAKGELVPSLESADPDKIIDAFRDLAMSAPLKKAVDDGRLQIYPVDLLNAASNRIRAAEGQVSLDEAGDDFERLRTDLTDYLNSSDYLTEFLSDSLRRADSLLNEAGEHLRHASLSDLAKKLDQLRAEKSKVVREKAIADRLQSQDWAKKAQALHLGIIGGMDKKLAEISAAAETHLRNCIGQWWESDKSLNAFTEEVVQPCKEGAAEEFVAHFRSLIKLEMARHPGGVDSSGALGSDLATLGINLTEFGKVAYAETNLVGELNVSKPKLKPDLVPVKKTFFDWIFFRSATRVRKILFGDFSKATKAISAATKEKRLRDEGREIILKQCLTDLNGLWSDSVRALPREYVDSYLAALSEKLKGALESVSEKLADQLDRLDVHIEKGEVIVKEAETARSVIASAIAAVQVLEQAYGQPLPEAEEVVEEEDGSTDAEPMELDDPAADEIEIVEDESTSDDADVEEERR